MAVMSPSPISSARASRTARVISARIESNCMFMGLLITKMNLAEGRIV